MTNKIDDAFKSVYAAKTAQSVWNDLRELRQHFTDRRTRWIWELLQNASDASTSAENCLITEIKYRPEQLIFLHNGRSFKASEVAHLIASGSTKYEDEEATGEFGTGFLTTHLLSLKIEVSGQLDDGREFVFPLVRDMRSREALYESMEQAEEDFKKSLNHSQPSIPHPFTTQFIYPIKDDAVSAVETGIETLEQCAPYVVVFNKKFDHIDININIKEYRKMLSFKAIKPPELGGSPIQQITVVADQNGNLKERKYLLAQSKNGTSVAVPLKSNQDTEECLSVENIPRIFKVFPLIGTESFSFPAVINNSSDFMPTVARDDVPLGESNDGVNAKNRVVIKEACELLVRLLEHAASKRWHYVHQWAEIPATEKLVEQSWLGNHIREELIEEICQAPVVITETNKTITPKDTWLPLAENNEGVKDLWGLLNNLKEYREKLPRQDEAIGWCKVIQSWARVNECEVPNLPNVGVIDGRKLASHIEDKCSDLKDLQSLLQENVCAIDWLNRLYKFLRKDNKIDGVIRDNRLVLNQSDGFNFLKHLHRDQKIGKELKDIAELLGWLGIRQQLRDPRLTSLDTEQGADDWDSKYIFEKLYTRIQGQAKPNPSNNFKEASARLFAWIVTRKDYSRLSNLPVFAEDGESVHSLPSSIQDGVPLLAPIRTWSADLQQFSDLFPPERILDDVFFEKVPEPDEWQRLSEGGFIRTNIVTTSEKSVNFKDFYPEESLPDGDRTGDRKKANHITVDHIPVTDIAERTGILARVANSRPRALVFWRFLTEWLIKEDNQGLEVKEAMCRQCGTPHKYYPAEWLMPVRNNRWIRYGDLHPLVEASSLTKMLRDNEWNLDSLKENPETVKLLEAIGITEFDFLRAFVAKNDEERNAQDQIFRDILAETGGDLNQIGYLRQILVLCQASVEGYSFLSLILASWVVNRQWTVARC